MNEEQILDFLITQSEILGLPKESCPYYQIMEFIQKDIEEIKVLAKLYYQASEKCTKYESLIEKQQKELEEVKAKETKYETRVKRVLMYLDYIDDEILETCSNYDVNGIEIVKILKVGD